MKKILVIAASLLLFSGMAGAQNYFNIGYGFATTTMKFGDMEPDSEDSNALFAGVSHNFALGNKLGFEAGLNFLYDFEHDSEELLGVKGVIKNDYMGLQMPLLLNYKLVDSRDLALKLFVGPTLHYGLSNKTVTEADGKDLVTVDYYSDNSYSRFNACASVAFAGEWMNKFRVKVGYDLGLTDFNNADKISAKENMIVFSLGYMF